MIKRCLYECLFQSVVIVMPLRRVVVVQRRWLLLLLLQLLQQLRAERRQPLHPRGHQHAGAELPRSPIDKAAVPMAAAAGGGLPKPSVELAG